MGAGRDKWQFLNPAGFRDALRSEEPQCYRRSRYEREANGIRGRKEPPLCPTNAAPNEGIMRPQCSRGSSPRSGRRDSALACWGEGRLAETEPISEWVWTRVVLATPESRATRRTAVLRTLVPQDPSATLGLVGSCMLTRKVTISAEPKQFQVYAERPCGGARDGSHDPAELRNEGRRCRTIITRESVMG